MIACQQHKKFETQLIYSFKCQGCILELYPYVHMILELREEPAAERKNLSSANL